MFSLSLLIEEHVAVACWVLVWLATVLAWRSFRGPVVPTAAIGTLALGTIAVAGLAPPPSGMVAGLPRSCFLEVGTLLWPWGWAQPDPRLPPILLMAVVGLCWAFRPCWVALAATVPPVLELAQWVLPGLGRACTTTDTLHAWSGLAAGLLFCWVGRRVAHLVGAQLLKRLTVTAAVGAVAVGAVIWPLGAGAVDPRATPPLWGHGFHGPSQVMASETAAWVEAGTLPGAGTPYEEMARVALWDLRQLTVPLTIGGLPAAGASENWGYFWPRDGSFVAVALARTGHHAEAERLLDLVAELPMDPLYGFDARYLLSGRPVTLRPRRAQVDGCGWVLWAIGQVQPSGEATRRLCDRCTDQLLRATTGGHQIPPPSQDYWEQPTYHRLLGASAPIAAGLRAAAHDYRALGAHERAGVVDEAAVTFRARIHAAFGPGYLRAGDHGGLDASTAMLMPPFDPDPLPGVTQAWTRYQAEAIRPAGGLAPGTAWKQDGISWTPEVALIAYTAAAAGDDTPARRWLAWLDEHRPPWGSLPEKVTHSGSPAGPARLAWTSALTLLTLDELD